MAVGLAASVSGGGVGTTGSHAYPTITGAISSGDVLVVFASWVDTTDTVNITGITDEASNSTWAQVSGARTHSAALNRTSDVWWCVSAAYGGSSTQADIALSASVAGWFCFCRLTGADSVLAVGAASSGGTPSSGSIPITSSDAFVLESCCTAGDYAGLATGYTSLGPSGDIFCVHAKKDTNITTPTAAIWADNAGNWLAMGIGVETAAEGGGPSIPVLMHNRMQQ